MPSSSLGDTFVVIVLRDLVCKADMGEDWQESNEAA